MKYGPQKLIVFLLLTISALPAFAENSKDLLAADGWSAYISPGKIEYKLTKAGGSERIEQSHSHSHWIQQLDSEIIVQQAL